MEVPESYKEPEYALERNIREKSDVSMKNINLHLMSRYRLF